MSKKIAFIGHREIFDYNKIREKLYNQVEQEIINGCKNFTMGIHGDFDKMALSVCKELRKKFKDITIEVVITNLNSITPIIEYDKVWGEEKYYPYKDVTTVMYDIEEEHYKRKIVTSNKKMIDTCSTLLCYVNTQKNYGGAILAYKYAKKKGLKITNLFDLK